MQGKKVQHTGARGQNQLLQVR